MKIAFSIITIIKEKPATDKLRQSWAKAQKEYILPFIYRHTENNKARYDTLNFLHPAQGNLTFRRRGYYETKDFLPLVTAKTEADLENINYKHNSSLKLFTVYTVIEHLYDSVIKQFVYHE